jgi:hypothetical protein
LMMVKHRELLREVGGRSSEPGINFMYDTRTATIE